MSRQKSADANDLEVDDPKQVNLRAYPVSTSGTKKRCFNAAWYQRWNWLKYSIKFDVAFCFPCRNFESKVRGNFRGIRCESTFTIDGYHNWKHAATLCMLQYLKRKKQTV